MPTFRVTGGALTLASVGTNYPDNALPGDQPGIDNSLPGSQPGIDNALPVPPPGVWPPPVPAHPIVPIPPGGSQPPPGTIWPPVINNALPKPPAYPDQGLPGSQPGIDNTLPPSGLGPHPEHPIATGTYWMLVYTPGYGWRYVVVDPSLSIWHDPAQPQPVPTPHG